VSDFDSLRVKVGRRPITIVEIDLDFCQNTYGISPCTAAIGTTGTSKCFNTFKTCQDPTNYNLGTKTYRFCSNSAFLPIGENIFPCITALELAPSQLVQEGFSVSAQATVTMQDFPHHDRGIDPYVGERTYNPFSQGSFFGKLRARNPYLVNRVMRVNTGYVDDDRVIYTKTRTYLIDHMEGPDHDGVVQLVGKDPTRFTDDDNYQVPSPSRGTLALDLDAVTLSFLLAAPGVGTTYPSSGVVRIDDELIAYSSILDDTLQGLTRGYLGTTADAHSAAANVQICVQYTNETVPNILYDLLINYAMIDPSFITLADWTDEADTWLGTFTSSVVLSAPAGVKDVVEEVLKATGSALWWDEESAQVRFKIIMPFLILQDVPILDETHHIVADSLTVEDEEDDRISRVITYFDLTSPIDDPDKANFNKIAIQIDTDSESVNAYGIPQALEITSRWTPSEIYADAIGDRMLYRHSNTPRQVTVRLDAKDATIKIGDLRDIESRLMQDFDGSNEIMRFITTEVTEVEVGTTYEYQMVQVAPRGGGRAALFAPDTMDDWTSATDDEKKNYLYISNDDGFMSDGSPGPTLC
jgi:hypothetical protein